MSMLVVTRDLLKVEGRGVLHCYEDDIDNSTYFIRHTVLFGVETHAEAGLEFGNLSPKRPPIGCCNCVRTGVRDMIRPPPPKPCST